MFLHCDTHQWYEVGGVGIFALGMKPLGIPSLDLFTMNVLCFVTFHLLCELPNVIAAGTALSPTIAVVIGPDVSDIIFTRQQT